MKSSRPKTGKRHPPGVPSQHDSQIPWAHDKYIPMSKATEYSSVYIPHKHRLTRKEKHHSIHKEASEYQFSTTSTGDFLSTTQIHRRYYATPQSGSKPGTPLSHTPSFIQNDSTTCFSNGEFIPPYFRSFSKTSNLPGSKSKTKNIYYTRYCQSAPSSRSSAGRFDHRQPNDYEGRSQSNSYHKNFRPQSGYSEERQRPSAFSDMYGQRQERSQPGYQQDQYQQPNYYSTEGPNPYGNQGYTQPGYNHQQEGYFIPPTGAYGTVFTQEEVNDQFSALKTEVLELHKVDDQGEWNFSKESSRFEKTIEGFQPASRFGETKPDLKNKPNPLLRVKETKAEEKKPSPAEKSPIIEEIVEDKSTTSVIKNNSTSTVNNNTPAAGVNENATTSSNSNNSKSCNASTFSLLKLPLEVTLKSQTTTNLTESGSVEEVEVEIHGSKTKTIITKPNVQKNDKTEEPGTTNPSSIDLNAQNPLVICEDEDFMKLITKDLKAIKSEEAKAFAKCRIQQILYEARFFPDSDNGKKPFFSLPLKRKRRIIQLYETSGDGVSTQSPSLAGSVTFSDSEACEV